MFPNVRSKCCSEELWGEKLGAVSAWAISRYSVGSGQGGLKHRVEWASFGTTAAFPLLLAG